MAEGGICECESTSSDWPSEGLSKDPKDLKPDPQIQLKARMERMKLAADWVKDLTALEKKNYPPAIASTILKVIGWARKWTEGFTREDAWFMQVTMWNIAGKNGEKAVTWYNKIEASIASQNSALAKVIKKKNDIVAQEWVAMVHDGKHIIKEIKAIPWEIKVWLGELIQKPDIVVDPKLIAKKEEARTVTIEKQGELVKTAALLQAEVQNADSAEKNAVKKWKEAIDAVQESGKKMDAVISWQALSVKTKDSTEISNEKPNPIPSQNIQASAGLKKTLEGIRNLTPTEQVISLTKERDSYIRNQLMHPDERQQKLISDFVESKKAILLTTILDEEFNKKLSDGNLTSGDILKQPMVLDLFLEKRGNEFYESFTDTEKNDVKIIEELLIATRKSDDKRQDAEQSARDFSEAIKNKNQAEAEYLDAAKQVRSAHIQLNEIEAEVQKSTEITQWNRANNNLDTALSTTNEESMSAYSVARRERFADIMQAELWWEMSTQIKKEEDGNYIIVSKNSWLEISKSWWSDFSTRKEARRAQIRYELFSPKPLDVFLSQDPEYIDKIKNDPIIQNLWRQMNPSEPMKLMDFRRLLMVAMMKKMDPEKYDNLSYREIKQQAWWSVIDEFRSAYQKSGWSLWLQNAGIEDIRKIMNLVVNPETWKAKSPSGKPKESI